MSALASPDSPVYMLTAARWWASKGLPVFPLHYPVNGPDGLVCSCGKACPSPAKHPMTVNGFEDATTDTEIIARWWHKHPHANIGIRMGVVVDLLDIDGEQGFESLEKLIAHLGGEPQALMTAESGRIGGGRHYYMQPAGKKALQGGKRGVPAGLDVKGEGGYAVAAPSQHISGNRYRLINKEPSGTVPWDTVYAALTADKPVPAQRAEHTPDPFSAATPISGSQGDTAYGLKALAGMCEEMRAQRQPGRDTLFNDLCVRAGTLIRDEKITRTTAEYELQQAAYSVTDHSFTTDQVDEKLQRSIDDGISGSYQIAYGPPPTRTHAPPEVPLPADAPWEPPMPLSAQALPVFPVHVLGKFAPYIEQVAADTQTPVDLAGMLSLSILSAAIGKGARVQVTDTWSEQLSLYVAVALPPGEGKSPVFKRLMEPMVEAERELVAAAMPQVVEARQQRRHLEQRAKNAEHKAAKNPGAEGAANYAEAQALNMEIATTDLPPIPRLFVDDVTTEALVQVLAEQGGQIALLSEEGGIFGTLAGRYSSGVPNLDAVLKAHDGGTIRVDRKTSEPLFVEKPALTMGLAVQPSVLRGMADEQALRGRGLVARFLYSVPASRVGTRDVVRRMTPTSPKEPIGDFGDVVRHLLFTRGRPLIIVFSRSSSSSFLAFAEELEARRHPDTGDLGPILDWSAKLDGATARLAGIFALGDTSPKSPIGSFGDVEVLPEHVERAIDLARYLIDHAHAAMALMDPASVDTEPAAQVLRWIKKQGIEQVSIRDVHRALKGRVLLKKVGAIEAAFTVLAQHGYIRRAPEATDAKLGRPTSPVFLVNPSELTA